MSSKYRTYKRTTYAQNVNWHSYHNLNSNLAMVGSCYEYELLTYNPSSKQK